MTYEAGNVGYSVISSDVALVRVPGIAGRRKHHRLPKAKVAKVAKVKLTAEELQAVRLASLEKARATRAAKPKAEKVAKVKAVKPVAELSEKATAMLNELRRIADAEGNVLVASIDLAGVKGRSIGALLSVLARRKLYVKGEKGRGVVKMPA